MITFNSKGLKKKRIIEKRYLKKKSLFHLFDQQLSAITS